MSDLTHVRLKYFALSSDHAVARAFWILTFALLTAIGAQIEIPHSPVPYTLQTFVVLMAGGLLGRRSAFLSMALYLLLGAVGFPVFSSFGFGAARLLGPTGGYLLAFPIAAYVIAWGIEEREKPWQIGLLMLGGLFVIFLLGTLQLAVVMGTGWSESLGAGFLIFSWWDLTKLVAATALVREFRRRSRKA